MVIFFNEGSIFFLKIASLFLIAQSGSFNPLPVRTQTILEPFFILFLFLISPANDAALAGSQKIPSFASFL